MMPHSLLKQVKVFIKTSSPNSSAVPRSNLQHIVTSFSPLSH